MAILSDNDLEHLHAGAGARMWVGVPYAPVSPAYSLVSQDYGKLRHILGTLTPGLVFAADGQPSRKAIAAVVPADVEVVLTDRQRSQGRDGHALRRRCWPPRPAPAVDAAHGHGRPRHHRQVPVHLGSTKQPKGVINTQRMLCANQQMLRQCLAFLADEPPVLVDWLPWNHTFGGNHNVGLVLYNGGTLYIDDGKPTPSGIGETLRNLREISPTIYFNVPKGFEEIATRDGRRRRAARHAVLSACKAFMFAGAGLSPGGVGQAGPRIAEAAIGERIRMITGLGMTETAPSCTFAVGTDVALRPHRPAGARRGGQAGAGRTASSRCASAART